LFAVSPLALSDFALSVFALLLFALLLFALSTLLDSALFAGSALGAASGFGTERAMWVCDASARAAGLSLRAVGVASLRGVGSLRGAAALAALRAASALRSLLTTPALTRAAAADGVRGGGKGNDGAVSLRGISIGMSTGMGRGCVSNSSGNPITPTPRSTAAPTRRRRARERATCPQSAAAVPARLEADVPCRNENRPMRCWSWAGERCHARSAARPVGGVQREWGAAVRGKPPFNTPPTV